MRKLFIIILLVISVTALSQTTGFNLPPRNDYDRANITLKDFTKYEGKSVHIDREIISFRNLKDNSNESIELFRVDYIRVKEGNQFFKWSALGALLMGLSSALSVYEYPGNENTKGTIAGFTIAGAVVGGMIGLTIPKWKTYYINVK